MLRLVLTMLGRILKLVPALFLLQLSLCGVGDAKVMRKNDVRARQAEAARRWAMSPDIQKRAPGVQNITFSNPRASGMLKSPILPLVVAEPFSDNRVFCGWEDHPSGRFRRWAELVGLAAY